MLRLGPEYSYNLEVKVPLEMECESIKEDRAILTAIMQEVAVSIAPVLEGAGDLTRQAPDEPCCDRFDKWFTGKVALEGRENTSAFIACPYCGTAITEQRREKYLS